MKTCLPKFGIATIIELKTNVSQEKQQRQGAFIDKVISFESTANASTEFELRFKGDLREERSA